MLALPVSNSTEQRSSSEATRSAVSQEIPRILLNPVVHCRVHNSQRLVRILSQINPVHAHLPNYYLQIHFYIILPFRPWSCEWQLAFSFIHQSLLCTSQEDRFDCTRNLTSTGSIILKITFYVLTAYRPVTHQEQNRRYLLGPIAQSV